MTPELSGKLKSILQGFSELAKRPGIMSLAGRLLEVHCEKQLAAYFRYTGAKIKQAHLEKLVEHKETAKHVAEMTASNIVRRQSHILHGIIERNYTDAMLAADKQSVMHEADSPVTVGSTGGLLSDDAAKYAAEEAAKQVQGINETTVQQIADLIATAVENQMTPADVSRDLRDLLDGMSIDRANLIARTEMADAFGAAALLKLDREDIEYMQLILSPDACPICESIAENGPVRVDDGFEDEDGETYDRSPIHPNCRCATVGARRP